MRTSKLLNKKKALFFSFFIFFNCSFAEEPVDIWNIDKSKTKDTVENTEINKSASEEISEDSVSVYDLNNNDNSQSQILLESNLEDKVSLYGLYDPDENNLSIEMWNKSEGNEIKKIFDKILSKDLSQDALDILEIALLTNSNTPFKNITKEEFYNFQKKFLL